MRAFSVAVFNSDLMHIVYFSSARSVGVVHSGACLSFSSVLFCCCVCRGVAWGRALLRITVKN